MLTIISLIVTVALLLYSMNHLDESSKCIIANLSGAFINLILMMISIYTEEAWGLSGVCMIACLIMAFIYMND